jgi:hypothetical protein
VAKYGPSSLGHISGDRNSLRHSVAIRTIYLGDTGTLSVKLRQQKMFHLVLEGTEA